MARNRATSHHSAGSTSTTAADKRKTRSSGPVPPAPAPANATAYDVDEEDVVMRDTYSQNDGDHHYGGEGDDDVDNEDNNNNNNDEDDEDDPDSSLVRLSEQYRRFSESQRELGHQHDELDDDNNNNAHDEDNDHDEDVHTDDESQSEDMMRSIHRAAEDHNDDDEDDHSDHSENEDEGDLDLENELLEGAFRSFANRLQRGHNNPPVGSSSSGFNHQRSSENNRSHAANSLAENMARMFPEAMGLFGGFGGGANGSRISGLIDGLKRRDDPYLVLETLNELSERLLMMNGLVAERGLPARDLAYSIVDILTEPMFMEELELQLVACRCLYNFLEINNDYVHSAVQAGAIEALQSKLLEISYIDLAEQALQTLEIISKVAGTQVFRRNCLLSCLQYLDFFTIHAQRKAINITANSVKYIRESEFELVEEIFPILQRTVVEFTDAQELDNSWLAISRIIKNFRSASTLLNKLINSSLLDKIISVISHSDTTLTTNLRLINTLSICARNDELSIKILEGGKIGNCIISSLAKYKKSTSEDSVSIEALMSAPKDLIISILDLIINLLPSEKNSILTIQFVKKNYSSISSHYENFVNEIFQLLINIYSSTVIFDIRRRVMVALIRIVSSLDDLQKLDNHSQVINLLASIVIQNKSIIRQEKKDPKPYMALLGSLILTHLLAEKDPERFLLEFEREGLIADTSSLLEILRSDGRSSTNDTNPITARSAQAGEIEENHDEEDENEEDDDVDNEERHRHEGLSSEEEEDDDDDEEEEEDEEEENFDRYDEDEDEEDEDDTQLYNISDQAIFKNLTIPQIIKHLTKFSSDIEQEYLSKKASGSSKLEHLRLLDEISATLKDDEQIATYSYNDWIQIWKNFKKALGDEKNSTTISSFELISSGFIEILSSLFTNESTGSPGCLCRSSFLDIFNHETFELLIKKLQEALTRSESFEIISCGLKTGENRAASLGKQVKVRLIADGPRDEQFDDLANLPILVHAIASFHNINGFLKRRVENPFFNRRQRDIVNSAGGGENRSDWHLEFSINGEVIPYDATIYGALYKDAQTKNPNFDTTRFWYEFHDIKFRKVEGSAASSSEFDDRYPGHVGEEEDELEILKHPITLSILTLLKILHEFNDRTNTFLNFKLTAKLNRQLEEPLIVASGILPSWAINITRKFPFLFPLDTRIFFLQSTSFGYSRLIQLWNNRVNQDQNNSENENFNGNNNSLPLGRPTRSKVRVSRSHLLLSAYKVLDKLGSQPSVLEIEFNDEAGTGLGPTLEFYANVSRLFCQKKLDIWRYNDEKDDVSEFVNHKSGLFPSPIMGLGAEKEKEKLTTFQYLGKFVARALLDNRIVDFHFNKIFFEIAQSIIMNEEILNKDLPEVGLEKLKYVDSGLYNSLVYLKKNKESVSDLEINFTLPGYPTIELIENGNEINVDSNNVDFYISKVVELSIGSGVKKQVERFIKGFSEVFPYSSMLIFSPNELVKLLGNANEDWSYETLISAIHADHGYTVDSPSVQSLITLMTKFSKQERRLFLQFLTGSPRLPIGGFKNLKPVFTVVLKHSEGDLKPDDYLPSVMTCANYLKLPNYSSPDILEERLMKAVNEGAGAFLLS